MKFNYFVNECTKFGFAFVLAMLIFMVLFLFYPSYSWAAPTTDSMLGYWKFDNNGTDSSNDGNTATNFGATYLTDKAITNFPNEWSVNFPSQSSYLEVPNQPGVTPTNKLTFSMWLKINATSMDGPIAGNYNSTVPTQGFGFFFSGSDNIVFRVGGDSVSLSTSINNITVGGEWVHLAGTWDGSYIRLYLNGVEKAVSPHTQTIDYASTSFIFGKFLGKLDDARLYNRDLSLAEINDLALGKHTSATWTGSTNLDYENTSNWNPNIIPDPYTIINIPNTTNKPQFSQAGSVGGINILAGSELRIGGFNFTINDSSVDGGGQPKNFNNQGSLYLYNAPTQAINGFINDTNSGTVVINGDPGNYEFLAGSQYYNLTVNTVGGSHIRTSTTALLVHGNLTCITGILDLMGDATVKGNIYLNGGILNVSSSNVINLHGNFSSISGSSFSSGTGTVDLKGGDQAMVGPNNFFNLVKNSATANTLSFDSVSTQSVSGLLSLHGATGQMLSLRSTTDGTQWRINPTGTLDISYLDVKDSLSSTVLIDAIGKNIIDSGNNFNWSFNADAPTISISTSVTSTSNPLFPVTGYAVDPNFVKEVLFSIDTTNNWQSCVANDGTFNGADEAFTCTPSVDLSSGSHTYYIKAIDIYDNVTSTYTEWTFVLDNVPPVISLLEASPTTTSATITWTTNENADSKVEYGLDNSYGNNMQDANYIQSHNIIISSLANCTTYHYRIKSKDNFNNLVTSADQTFITTGCGASADTTPPVISNISATVGNNETTVGWVTDEDATSIVEYGLTTAYGSTINQSSSGFAQNHSILIPNLTVCTTYHYLVRSRDSASNLNSSADQSFTTGGCTTTSTVSSCTKDAPDEPEITSIQVEDKDSVILKIDEASGEVDEYEIKYGKSTENYEWEIDEIDEDDIDSYTIDELSPDTTYYFKVRAINECEKGDWSDVESAKTDKEEVLTNYLASNASILTTPKTPIVESAIEPITEATSAGDNNYTSENNLDLSEDEKVEEEEREDEFEDAKESKAPVIEECGSTSIEMIESQGRKKLKLEGFGPPNTTLTVYVYSDDPVVLSVKTDSNGDWSYVLEDNLEDGEHQVYVAITEESGRIKGKSNPLVFVKTAQAVSVISNQSVSPTQKAKSNFMILSIVLSIAAILLALAIIGWRFRVQKTDEKNFS